MYERFTDRALKVVRLAAIEAWRCKHESLDTQHLLVGLVMEGSGVAANVLRNLGADFPRLRTETDKVVEHGTSKTAAGSLPESERFRHVMEYVMEEARNLNHNYAGTEHLLLGLLRDHESATTQILANLGLTPESVRQEVLALLGHGLDQ